MNRIKAPLSLRGEAKKNSAGTFAATACACTLISFSAFAQDNATTGKTVMPTVVAEGEKEDGFENPEDHR